MARSTTSKASHGRGSTQQQTFARQNKHGLRLSFESTIQNRTLPPCDRNGFMDYLVYVERRAENLQFFLWYCDYVERWTRLSPRMRQLAPAGSHGSRLRATALVPTGTSTITAHAAPTVPARPAPIHHTNIARGMSERASPKGNVHGLTIDTTSISTLSTISTTKSSSHRGKKTRAHNPNARMSTVTGMQHRLSRSASSRLAASVQQPPGSEKRTHVLAILEQADLEDREAAAATAAKQRPRPKPGPSQAARSSQASSVSSSHSAASAACSSYSTASVPLDAPPAQPFRQELDRIVAHYIDAQGARALPDLFGPEREACRRAAQRTTHPSALLPAFLAAEAVLRTQSFPAFAHRYCVRNVWGARLTLIKTLSVASLLLGVVLLALIVLLGNTPARIVCLALWWPAGAALMLAMRQHMDMVLHLRGRRMLYPWENAAANDAEEAEEEAEDALHTEGDDEADLEKGRRGHRHHHHPPGPRPKPSLRPLGPRNNPDAEPWAIRAAQTPLYRQVLGELGWLRTAPSSSSSSVASSSEKSARTAAVQNRGVRALQDRAVLEAVLWAGLASTVVTVGSLFIPCPICM